MTIMTGMEQVSIVHCTVAELLIMLNFTVGSALAKVASGRASESNKDSFWQLSEVTKAGVKLSPI